MVREGNRYSEPFRLRTVKEAFSRRTNLQFTLEVLILLADYNNILITIVFINQMVYNIISSLTVVEQKKRLYPLMPKESSRFCHLKKKDQ